MRDADHNSNQIDTCATCVNCSEIRLPPLDRHADSFYNAPVAFLASSQTVAIRLMHQTLQPLRFCSSYLVVACLLCAGGCKRSDLGDEPSTPPTVSVSKPVERVVTDYAQFVGRTEAVNAVDIKARVTGYLMATPFEEGSEVKQGDVLCDIDPRTYQAQVDAAQGELGAYQAKYELAKAENERAKALYKENPQAISLKALDQHQAAENAAAASVVAAKSSLEVYKLNLEFTKITSPIDGRVGRYQVTIGNLVTENTTTLTTVVSQDPVYAYFNVDEPTMLAILRKLFAGTMPPLNSRKVQIGMGLQDEQGFPHQGTADFADNTVDPSTGTLTVRAAFPNPTNKNGLRMLLPGMFVRIRLPLGPPASATLVAEQAIGTDQGQKYVYVVNDQGAVEYRRVALGPLQDDGLRVIREGVTTADQVIVSGLQLVQPKSTVAVEVVAMPTIKTGEAQGMTKDE